MQTYVPMSLVKLYWVSAAAQARDPIHGRLKRLFVGSDDVRFFIADGDGEAFVPIGLDGGVARSGAGMFDGRSGAVGAGQGGAGGEAQPAARKPRREKGEWECAFMAGELPGLIGVC